MENEPRIVEIEKSRVVSAYGYGTWVTVADAFTLPDNRPKEISIKELPVAHMPLSRSRGYQTPRNGPG